MEKHRLNITLSDTLSQLLTIWSSLEGKRSGEYASQIVASRIGANIDHIEKLIAWRSQLTGQTREEVIQECLGEAISKDTNQSDDKT